MLMAVFNRYVNGDSVPAVTPIHKEGRKDLCENHRGTSVASPLSGLYGRVLKFILEEEYQPFGLEQGSGFRLQK
jgi:hypothetical protein